jgi:nitrogen-specific signal transduction histidine kinase
MSAGLAHEIRNPLAGIKGAAQYLQEQVQKSEQQEFLQLIVSETDRLNLVVSQFLSYARPLQLQLEQSNINELLHNVVELEKTNHHNREISYELIQTADLREFSFDTNLIHQVILNLVQNAAQAMTYRGTIIIRSKIGYYLYAPHQGQPSVEISITDTGPGITKEEQKKLFIPFFTTKENGTGLGLAISQRLIEAHSGNISVQSQVNNGTTFIISLPILLDS